jgi:hypothetical protein
VLATESGAPIRRAQVRLMSGASRRTRRRHGSRRALRVRDPPGRYTLNASKPASCRCEYGQRRAFEQGKPIEMLDAQVMDTLTSGCRAAALITRRILDEFVSRWPTPWFQALQHQSAAGASSAWPRRANQRPGQCRIFGLSPGE